MNEEYLNGRTGSASGRLHAKSGSRCITFDQAPLRKRSPKIFVRRWLVFFCTALLLTRGQAACEARGQGHFRLFAQGFQSCPAALCPSPGNNAYLIAKTLTSEHHFFAEMYRQPATANMCFHPRTSLAACPALLARRGFFDLCHQTSSRFHNVHTCTIITVYVFATGACRFAWTTATQQQQLFFKVLVHQKLRPQSHLRSLHWSQHCNKTGHLWHMLCTTA